LRSRERAEALVAVDDHLVGFNYTGGGAGATFAAGKPASVQDVMLDFPG
jgi:hypothetical protein